MIEFLNAHIFTKKSTTTAFLKIIRNLFFSPSTKSKFLTPWPLPCVEYINILKCIDKVNMKYEVELDKRWWYLTTPATLDTDRNPLFKSETNLLNRVSCSAWLWWHFFHKKWVIFRVLISFNRNYTQTYFLWYVTTTQGSSKSAV